MAVSLGSRKAGEWQRRLARFRRGRQSVAEFCRKEGVSAPSFYLWRRRLAQPPVPAGAPVELRDFAPIRLTTAASVSVELPGGTALHVPTSDREALRVVIAALVRADARRTGAASC